MEIFQHKISASLQKSAGNGWICNHAPGGISVIPHEITEFFKIFRFQFRIQTLISESKIADEKMIAPLDREIDPEWIPINNKPPQNGQRIFISTATGKIHDIVWNSECIHNSARNGCWYKNCFVIAWMPFFIEPYKAESEDNS